GRPCNRSSMHGRRPAPGDCKPTRLEAKGPRKPTSSWPATAGAGERSVRMARSSEANRQVITLPGPATQAQAAAERVITRIAANSGRVAICLSGGSSPKQLFELLATDAYRSRIPWDRVHWFMGDERFVPADDHRNNMRMARRAFLDKCAPAANVHPISTDTATPAEAAQRYESELK